MTALSITAANVGLGDTETITSKFQAGEAITQGQPFYLSSNRAYKTDADVSTKHKVAGIAMTAASTNGYFIGATEGLVAIGATVAIGTVYVISPTAGSIMPSADLASDDYVSILGVGTTTAIIDLQINNSGVAVP